MGYGEYGGGGSLLWRVIYDTPDPPESKPGRKIFPRPGRKIVPPRVHFFGKDDVPDYGDILTVIVKRPESVLREADGSIRLEVKLSEQPDQVQLYWKGDRPPRPRPRGKAL